ncbi:hypothetical protein ANCCAN_08546 [Ancylostoma caninum]|uniref:Uncharacterized protein n=1 Tax=Ancylostoma caninum TaxID=29170 RepID=A0A368GQA6_ANCCA|nr:hypothetical protein ANCCAN_08546 [Ancylostoma caninum]
MQARKIRYDVIGLTETRRHRPLNATFDTRGEVFLGACDSWWSRRSPKHVIDWGLFTSLPGFWEDAVVDNIDEEYDVLVQYIPESTKSAEGSRVTKRRLSYETLELIRQGGAARAAGNYQLTSELAKRSEKR